VRSPAAIAVPFLLVHLVGLGLAVAQPAAGKAPATAADKAPSAADVQAERAKKLHARGVDLMAKGDDARAREALQAAWDLQKDASTAADLGAVELTLKRHADAAEHLSFAIQHRPTTNDPEGRTQATALTALYQEARAACGGLRIDVDVDGADVFVDGKLVGQAPLDGEVFVEPGQVSVSAKASGAGEVEKVVRVAAGRSAAVRLATQPAAPDAVGEQTPEHGKVPRAPASRLPIFVLGGAGLLAGGIGIGLFAAAGGKTSTADQNLSQLQMQQGAAQPCAGASPPASCSTIQGERASSDAMTNAATGLLVGGGIAVAAAVAYAIWLPPSHPDQNVSGRVSIVPVLSPSAGGAFLRGTF
jgi:PEGA domain